MTKAHVRTSQSKQIRAVRYIVGKNAFQDKEAVETANTLSMDRLIFLVTQEVGDCSIATASIYDPGEIIIDNEGKGSRQIGDQTEALKALTGGKGWER